MTLVDKEPLVMEQNGTPCRRVALIAHDRKKESLLSWVSSNIAYLEPHNLVATKTTGSLLLEHIDGLSIETLKSGPMGGDQQIGALIADEKLDLLIFFTDPLSPHPHDVDVKALSRLATVYDVPIACSPKMATLVVQSGFLGRLA